MMEAISEIFSKKKVLIPYITAGDPNLATTEKLVYDLEKCGANIVELGIPFSDPLADGPIIQASHQRALKNNTSLKDVFKLIGKIRKKTQIPICLMLAYNLILQFGAKKFFQEVEGVGVNGVIVPDLPPEEELSVVSSPDSIKDSNDPGSRQRRDKLLVDMIYLVAPTSTDEHIKLVAEKSSGFIYLVSLAGITGTRKKVSSDLGCLISRVRKNTWKPIAVGFGISKPEHAREVARLADGVIVGSAIVDLIAKKKFKAVTKFVVSLRRAIDAAK